MGFNFDSDRLSFSEPDLPASLKHLDRFVIKHPHEYITVDELKFYRRRKPPEHLTKSNICLTDLKNDLVLPFSPLKSEYRRSYLDLAPSLRTLSLRKATSLRLEGLMPLNRSEHQDRYLWFTPEDYKSSRSYPMKKPESLHFTGGFDMEPEYRSSYVMYPMVDRATKILPREMFSLQSPVKTNKTLEKSSVDVELIQKVNEDKVKREKASDLQQECHLQRRAITDESHFNVTPSEYQRQFVPQLIEKAHSIPQMSHIKMQGDFHTIPEYQDSFKMYASYSKPMPIIKSDNLLMSGSEIQINPNENSKTMPEYREKFHDLPKEMVKEKSLKTEDHLRPNGDFSKDVPEYFESFRDPQVKQLPEKGKCREPYLHLKGKLEFNPEYRNTYLNFPRSRPIVPKPTSTFRLPTSNTTTTTNSSRNRSSVSPRKYEGASNSTPSIVEPETDITITPEYRRACYNYQIRERSPKQKAIIETPMPKDGKKFHRKSVSPQYQKTNTALNRQRRPLILESPQSSSPGLENIGQQYKQQKTPKFGRRATGSVLKNAENCRANTSIIEGNPKYTMTQRKDAYNSENIHDSFVVLENNPFKRSHWMK
ncbi:uncharacterized protein LOC119600477 [Lucilia sericata]|uniref:uncharacterized protein LOC119600477 n=1 Tax=Lucilia sericata TaxID=13632 RepID=UPI0018A802BA|nr:uncharacterized protein LOC119600477 [Lucilia sericata]